MNSKPRVMVGPRIAEENRDYLGEVWENPHQGAEWILASWPNLYRRTLQEMRGYWITMELDFILDAVEVTTFFPEMAGQSLLYTMQDGHVVLTAVLEKHPEIILASMIDKLKRMSFFSRACLEIWARSYRLRHLATPRGEYISQLLPT